MFADEVHSDVTSSFFRDKIVRSVMLILVTENLRNFQKTHRMAKLFPTLISAWGYCPSIRVFGFSQDLQLQIMACSSTFLFV